MVNRPLVAIAVLAALTTPVVAQQPDTLAQRVERLERLVAILQGQVAEQSEGGVAPRSGNSVELSGLVLVNAFTNNGNPHMDDVPQYVEAPSVAGTLPSAGASASVRQTRLTLTTSMSDVLGASFTGELDIDFFGGQHPSSGGRTFPNLRIRRTRADLRWSNFSLMIGQEAPPVVELNPSSLAAMGYPGFSGSGNLWLWLPQVRARFEAGTMVRIGLEGAALAPNASTKQPDPMYTKPDQAERSRRPFTEGRIIIGWGDEETGGELSVGGHYGWLATTTTGQYLITKAAAAHARFFVTRFVEIRAEAFTGQGLRSLGGGGVYQNFGSNGVMLRSRGGWAQLNLIPTPEVEIGGGVGLDDPNDDDFDPADYTTTFGRTENRTFEGHIHWRPFPLVFGIEFRRMETTWGSAALGTLINNHINVAAGFEF